MTDAMFDAPSLKEEKFIVTRDYALQQFEKHQA